MIILDDLNYYYVMYFIIIIIILCVLFYFYTKKKYNNIDKIGINIPIEIYTKNNKLRGTILDIFMKISIKYPHLSALMVKKTKKTWNTINYSKFYEQVLNFAESTNHWFGNKIDVALIGNNSTGWLYSHLGTMLNGGISVIINPNYTPAEIEQIINKTNPTILIIDGNSQLNKIVDININNIQTIVYYSPIEEQTLTKFKIPVVSIGSYMSEKKSIDKNIFPKINDIASIIYTEDMRQELSYNGTVYTHKNIMSLCYSILDDIQNSSGNNFVVGEKYISHLSINNIFTQIFDIYLPICTLGRVWVVNQDISSSKLMTIINNVKPSIFIGTRSFWNNLKNNMTDHINSKNYIDNIHDFYYSKNILQHYGFDQCKLPIICNNDISESTSNFFANLNLNIYDFFCLSKSHYPIAFSFNGQHKKYSIGKHFSSIKTKINTKGEILIKGALICMDNDELDENNDKSEWYNTKFVGYVDSDNFIFIKK